MIEKLILSINLVKYKSIFVGKNFRKYTLVFLYFFMNLFANASENDKFIPEETKQNHQRAKQEVSPALNLDLRYEPNMDKKNLKQLVLENNKYPEQDVSLNLEGCSQLGSCILPLLSSQTTFRLFGLNLSQLPKLRLFANAGFLVGNPPITFNHLTCLNLDGCSSLRIINLVAPQLEILSINCLPKLKSLTLDTPLLQQLNGQDTSIDPRLLCNLILGCPQFKKITGNHLKILQDKFNEDNNQQDSWPTIFQNEITQEARILAFAFRHDLKGMPYEDFTFMNDMIQPEYLTKINISDRKLNSGFIKNLKIFSNLTKLKLINAGLEDLSEFPKMDVLELLDLRENKIKKLPDPKQYPALGLMKIDGFQVGKRGVNLTRF